MDSMPVASTVNTWVMSAASAVPAPWRVVIVNDVPFHAAREICSCYVGDYLRKGGTNNSSRIGTFRMPGCGGR